MSIADTIIDLAAITLGVSYGIYWRVKSRQIDREIRELQDESAAPEGWDAVRRIEQERRE